VTRTAAGRLVVTCDRCPVRMDLGPEAAVRARNRAPSGWVSIGGDRHYCPRCSQTISLAALARAVRGPAAQPLR
jgi:hypothetical protein